MVSSELLGRLIHPDTFPQSESDSTTASTPDYSKDVTSNELIRQLRKANQDRADADR